MLHVVERRSAGLLVDRLSEVQVAWPARWSAICKVCASMSR
jgi:hypothetical protein